MWMIYSLYDSLLNILFPKSCFLCKKQNNTLCEKCIQTFTKTVDTPATYIHSIYSFRDLRIKKIIHAIKYFYRKDLIEPLTRKTAEELLSIENNRNYILVPIPMPPLRKYTRGYNQAELIAHNIAKKTLHSVNTSLLYRSRTPKRQVTTKTKTERLKNQHNTFFTEKDLSGLHIALIDDVTTTGSTIFEARKTLLQHGASSVIAFTIAH
jgi:ComF family protein